MTHLDAFLRQQWPKTAATYEPVLRSFLALTGRLDDATQDDVVRYFDSIAEQAPATVARKLSTIGSYFAYLRRRGIRDTDPMLAIGRRPKVDKAGSIRWLTDDQQRALIQAVDGSSRKSQRNLALLWTLLHGLRVAEVVNLDADDYRNGELRFTGKGNKSRTVPLLTPAQVAMERCLNRRRAGPLFRGPHGRLTTRQVQRFINQLSMDVLGERWNPHALRHSFATRNLRAGMGLAHVQRLLGHADPKTTSMYEHLNTDDLRRAMQVDPLGESGELVVIEGGKEATG